MVQEFKGESGRQWKYDEHAPLGRAGGFGSVYAGSGDDGSDVAVKVVSSILPSGKRLDSRLRDREIEIGRKLEACESKHLIRLLDVGSEGDNLLIVMERAEGALEVPVGGLGPAEAIAILREVACGVQELHGAAVIHRDLKPSNVLRHDGVWKLADFGIAHDVDIGTQDPTFKGAGTLPYMAPELWALRSANVKTDLYALGCLGFELVDGKPPFRGPGLDDYRRQHCEESPPRLEESVSPVYRDLIVRLLSKEPASRPQDARAVIERLDRVSSGISEVQRSLQELSVRHAEERAEAVSKDAGARAEDQARRDVHAQALADLSELVGDGLEYLQRALPDIELSTSHGEIRLHGADGELILDVWDAYESPIPDDSLAAGGSVDGQNRRVRDRVCLANIVYERADGRYAWYLYRFRRTGITREYRYGPRDRVHGLRRDVFLDPTERGYMIRTVVHAWSLAKEQLNAEGIGRLYKEALELAPRASL